MATYQIYYDPETRTALVVADGGAPPEGEDIVDIGEFEYEPGDINKFYHHVRDALYHCKPDGTEGFWPENETDMQRITILGDVEAELVGVTGVTLIPSTVEIEVGDTSQLTKSVEPANATDQTVTWESDDGLVATVSETGLVTAIGVGEATITVTTTDGEFTDTSVVTVVAAEPVPDEAPTNDEAPVIAGDAEVDATLTATPGEWSGNPEPVLTYQWQTGDGESFTNIDGATSSTYVLLAGDEGNHIRVAETATNTEGNDTVYSNSIGPITNE